MTGAPSHGTKVNSVVFLSPEGVIQSYTIISRSLVILYESIDDCCFLVLPLFNVSAKDMQGHIEAVMMMNKKTMTMVVLLDAWTQPL